MLCKSTISKEDIIVDAQPGMARSVKNFTPRIMVIINKEKAINKMEKVSNLTATFSINTEIAPRP